MSFVNIKFDIPSLIKSRMNFNVARRYHLQDCVQTFKIMPSSISTVYGVNAILEIRGEEIECSFSFDDKGRLVNYHCDCYFCTTHSPCAHIGAVLFKINNCYIKSIPYEYPQQKQMNDLFDFEEYMRQLKEKQLEEQRRLRQEKEERERRARQEMMERIRKEEEEKQRAFLLSRQNSTNLLIAHQKYLTNQQMLSLVDPTIYSLYPEVSKNGDKFSLSYRIGTSQKKYVVKSISDLVRYFKNKEAVSYGKNVIIRHEEERFDDFSVKQIKFLEKTNGKPYINRYYDYEYRRLGKSIPLDIVIPGLIHDFFETYQTEKYPSFKCENTVIQIPLRLETVDDYSTLQLQSEIPFVLESNELYIMPQEETSPYIFKRMMLDPGQIVMKLLRELNASEGIIYIHHDHFEDFYKYVLQPIKNYIVLDGQLPENIGQPLYKKVVVHGDVNEHGEIVFEVNYIDDFDVTTPAFQENEKLDFNQEMVEMVMRKYAKEIQIGKVYFDSTNENTLKFCSEGVLKLQPYCDIYISEALKRISQKPKHTITVGVRVENDLIHIDVDSLEIPKEELANVLSAYRRKKKFYRLKNGEMINVDSEAVESLDHFMEEYHIDTKELKKDDIQLNKYRMFDVEETTNNEESLIVTKEQSYQQLLENFKELSTSPIEIPEAYSHILRDYQKEGYRWLHTMYQYGFNGILADDMGLGKTLQVISLLDGIASRLPSIVVCPASLVYNWEDEVHKFSKRLKVCCVVGSKSQRLQHIQNVSQYDLLVTSYDYMRRDIEDYQHIQFEYVILDEAQNIKNQKTKNAESVKRLKSNHRLALTGTPIENTLAELWSIFDFLMPDYLFNYHYFKKKYESPIVKNGDGEISNRLKQIVSPFILRRNKKEVLKELPDKIESVQLIPFSEDENKLYLASLAQINEQLAEMLEVEQVNDLMILAMLTRLRQLCIEPRMVYENIKQVSSKMQALLELLIQLKENKQKVLVFSAFPSVFEYIEDQLKQHHISYMELTGQNNKEERREMVEQFQKGAFDVFLISLKAGGTGLNLTEASAVIHIDPWWNLSAQNQATDRAHRIGQKNTVQVFKLVMKNSIEEKIVQLQEKKKELADLFVENNEGNISKMTKSEIIDLFKMD